jgi:hypothetical protein
MTVDERLDEMVEEVRKLIYSQLSYGEMEEEYGHVVARYAREHNLDANESAYIYYAVTASL